MSILADSHPRLHFHIFAQANQYISCGVNDVQADLVAKQPLTEIGEYEAMIQSWQLVYIPYLNLYLLRNAQNVFLGVSTIDDSQEPGADAGLRGGANNWIIEEQEVNLITQTSKGVIKNVNTNKYLVANGAFVTLDSDPNNATLWNFEISGTVPPP